MSRAYIVTRNGGTVTKAPINDNKIPIYPNKTAMEADASNIPEGSIVFTKSDHDDVIDQMKEYIRNQNVLSDWEDITLSMTPTEMRYDGFLNILASASTSLWVNDVQLVSTPSSDYYTRELVFKKGDSIKQQYSEKIKVAYYKLRDYSDRT